MAFKGYFTLCLHRTSNLNSLVSNSNLMKQIELKSKNNNSFFSGHNSNLQTRQFHSKIEIKSKSNQTFDFENGLKSSCDQQQFFMNQESTKQFHSTIMKNNNQTSLIFNLIPKFSNLSLFSNIIFQTRNFATKNVAALLHRERRQKTIEAQTMKREEMVEKQKQRQLYRERKERLAALETNKHELQSSSSEQSQTQTQTPTSTSTPTMSKLENEEKDMEFMTDEQYEKLVAQQEPPEPLTEEEIAELRKIGYDLPEDFGVNSQSTWSPKEIIKVKLVESELEEKFIRGSGNGGQAVNKTSNCVFLKHKPTGISVKVHAERSLMANRRIARQFLTLKLDKHFNGKHSKMNVQVAKQQKRKAKAKKRAQKKYNNNDNSQEESDVLE